MPRSSSSRLLRPYVRNGRPRTSARRISPTLRWSIVLGYSLFAVGVPLPNGLGKASGESYPCMDHQCGCASAEECWRHCCCMSLVEKLTWAREHHINPPIYVILEARQQGIDWMAFCDGGVKKQTMQCSNCCARCAHESSAPTAGQQPNRLQSKSAGNPSQSVVLGALLKCHGAAQSWLSLGSYIPPPASRGMADQDALTELLVIRSDRADSLSFRPARRPPRSPVG
jgi:hypothetical protein